MSLYIIEDDEGLVLGDCMEFETNMANAMLYDEPSEPEGDVKEYGGHVVKLVEAPEKIVVSEEEAEMLTEAKTATYPAEYITRHSCLKQGSEDRLMRAYVNGWAVEKPKRWNVKVPHTKHLWYYKSLNEDLRTISVKELCSEFTESDIEHYDLQDCEKEEVADDEQ